MTNNNSAFDTSRASWLARGFEQLLDGNGTPSFDVVIIGSGYGGAIAAATLAGREDNGNPIRVCVLERGNEYLPGSFPKGFAEVPGHVRMEQNKEGLFDARPGPDVSTLVANGVGGGSLINAGVMEVPHKNVFKTGWPAALSDRTTWETFFDEARTLVGASDGTTFNTIDKHPDGIPTKTAAIKKIGDKIPPSEGEFRYAALTVAMTDSHSTGGVNLNQCVRCGDCATGCNFGAKISLDVGLLASAHRRGAEIYSGATVLDVERDSGDWIVNTVFTNADLRERLQGNNGPARIRAKKVILAAGTLGSTEILKRSEGALKFSDELGKHCSTNGDMLITDYETENVVNTVANENTKPSKRSVGPTITGVIDLREHPEPARRALIEEISVPAGIRRVFGEIFATAYSLHRLNKADHSTHHDGFPGTDLHTAHHRRIEQSALYAVMGDDGAGGEIELVGDSGINRDGIGRIKWEALKGLGLFDDQVKTLEKVTGDTGGEIIPNPLWKLLPKEMAFLLGDRRGPVVTVHPLGGCVMADTVAAGVVDDVGRVYDASGANTHHDGLVVLDGSIIPTALSTNPALTIAAVALRAARVLANEWSYTQPQAQPLPPIDRPVARVTDEAFEPLGTTQIQVCERMHGEARLRDQNGTERDCVVELTMRFLETSVSHLSFPGPAKPAEMGLDTTQDGSVTASRVRIYEKGAWDTLRLKHMPDGEVDDELDAIAIYRAPLTAGKITVFERRASTQFSRFFQAGPAYLLNRGLRDIWQAMFDPDEGGGNGGGIWQRTIGYFRLASRAGEQRSLRYELKLGAPDAGSSLLLPGDEIVGRKLFTYARRVNPWRQLMRMRLTQFPGLVDEADVDLDPNHLVRIGIPLIRVTKQADGVTALAELGSFVAYLVRLLIGIHLWSFRKPERGQDPVTIDCAPRDVPDIPVPAQTFDIDLGPEVPDGADDGVPVPGKVRLTRFENPAATKPPIVMLHGYSASGTTFAHPDIPRGLAHRFWHDGRSVWIADMRTSPATDTATHPWSMEQIAYRDIPEIFEYIVNEEKPPGMKIDVLAHCMGAVMFSMAILRDDGEVAKRPYPEDKKQLLRALPSRIRKVAMSQVGPLVVFSPANRFRAYAARYLDGLLPGDYQFRPTDPDSLPDQLLDRALASLPYPDEEFDRANPVAPWKRTPWTRTRHRMDALYGRDFNLMKVPDAMLHTIDDHFGAISIGTVTQTIHFARYSMITDRSGYNAFVSRNTLTEKDPVTNQDRWHFPVLSVHGRHNGLSDVTTVSRMAQILGDAGRHFEEHVISDAGHQDSLVGQGRDKMAAAIIEFFDGSQPGPGNPNDTLMAETPWIGPLITTDDKPPVTTIRLGASPQMRAPEAVIMLRVRIVGGELRRHDNGLPFGPGDENFVATNMVLYNSSDFADRRWDAFPMPQPPALPAAGNGLLVLITYAESRRLPQSEGSFFRALADRSGNPIAVQALNRGDWSPEPGTPDITVAQMKKHAAASLAELLRQRLIEGVEPGTPPPSDPNTPGPIE